MTSFYERYKRYKFNGEFIRGISKRELNLMTKLDLNEREIKALSDFLFWNEITAICLLLTYFVIGIIGGALIYG